MTPLNAVMDERYTVYLAGVLDPANHNHQEAGLYKFMGALVALLLFMCIPVFALIMTAMITVPICVLFHHLATYSSAMGA